MSYKIITIALVSVTTLSLAARESSTFTYERFALDYYDRMVETFRVYLDLEENKLPVARRKDLVRKIISKRLSDRSHDVTVATIGYDLLYAHAARCKLRNVPFWLIAAMHKITCDKLWNVKGDDGFATLLRSKEIMPKAKIIISCKRPEVGDGMPLLYGELCAIILKGVRKRSLVALKLLTSESSTASVNEILKLNDKNFQKWFERELRRSIERQTLTPTEINKAFRQLVVDLLDAQDESKLNVKIDSLNEFDALKRKKFTSKCLKLVMRAPAMIMPCIDLVSRTALKNKNTVQLKRLLKLTLVELKDWVALTEYVKKRLNAPDVRRRTSDLQKTLPAKQFYFTSFEKALNDRLDELERKR